MSQPLRVEVDFESFRRDLRALGDKAPIVMARSLNGGGSTADIVRDIGRDMGIRSGDIAKLLRVKKATARDESFEIEVQGRRIPLIAFKAQGPEPSKGKGRGVSYAYGTSGGRKTVPHAFIARMPGGHRGVYQRRTKARLPIYELFGPSLPHVFEKFVPRFMKAAEAFVIKNVRHEIDFETSKRVA